VQTATPLATRHKLLGPQGEGWQGSVGASTACTGLHAVNGSPEVPGGQLQDGMWLITSQTAAWPQVPGQGSTQRWFTHARVRWQSEFIVHSGRHPVYGSPKKLVRQEQAPSRHSALGPHGDGLQGSLGGGGVAGMMIGVH
jgi:hypothetical protein